MIDAGLEERERDDELSDAHDLETFERVQEPDDLSDVLGFGFEESVAYTKCTEIELPGKLAGEDRTRQGEQEWDVETEKESVS